MPCTGSSRSSGESAGEMSKTRQRKDRKSGTFSRFLKFPGVLRDKLRARGARWRKIALVLLAVVLLGPPLLLLALRIVPPPLTPLMVIRLFEGEGLRKEWVSLEEMPAALAEAAVASEDNLFCTHSGFDWKSINAAIEDWRAGERLRGGSTISMQTAKNLFLWPGRSFLRKGLEAALTVQLELLWDKRRIMEVYLNVAETGPGIYGVAAAAEAHFGKSVGELSPRESALVIAVLPNPREWSAGKPSAYIEGRARTIRARMRQLGPLLDCLRDNSS